MLDDFDAKNDKDWGHFLKIWADKFAVRGEIKGGSVNLLHEVFIVTSNYTIDECFSFDKTLAKAIKDRFVLKNFNKIYAR